jgi:TatD DNase family protein
MSLTTNNLAPKQGGGGVPSSLVDSHAHLDFYDDPTEILANARTAGLSAILAIGIGQGPDTMHRALEIAQSHSTSELPIYASAGIHPQEAHQATEASLEKLATLAVDPRIRLLPP